MQFNVQYIKKLILAEMAGIFDKTNQKGSSPPQISLQGVPFEIDSEVIKGKYLMVTCAALDLESESISLSSMQAIGVFDNSGMLSKARASKSEEFSWVVSAELEEACQKKPFGTMSDFQTLALWAGLKGVYQTVRSAIEFYHDNFAEALEAEVSSSPSIDNKELYESLKSLSKVTLDIQQYLSEFFSFKEKNGFSLTSCPYSQILLKEGMVIVAESPRKTVIVLPVEQNASRPYVSEKQWANILTRSDKSLNIFNLEPVSFIDGVIGGFNYFIPNKEGCVYLPSSFANLTAKSSLVGVVDRIHVYKVTLSNKKVLTVTHFPLQHEQTSQEALQLSERERQYLHRRSITTEESLLVHGGSGSEFLLKLIHSHTAGEVLTMDDTQFNLALGIAKQPSWPENFFETIDMPDEPSQLTKNNKMLLLKEAILSTIKEKKRTTSEQSAEQLTDELNTLEQLMIRVQNYDLPDVAELGIEGVRSYTELATYLFHSWLARKDTALSYDISWLMELIIIPIDGPSEGIIASLDSVMLPATEQNLLVKMHIKGMAIQILTNHLPTQTEDEKKVFESLAEKLFKMATGMKRLCYRNDLNPKSLSIAYKIQALLSKILVTFESKIIYFGTPAVLNDIIKAKRQLSISIWLINNSDEVSIRNICGEYLAAESIVNKGMKGIEKLPKHHEGVWITELGTFTDKEIHLAGKKPSALMPFISILKKSLDENIIQQQGERENLSTLARNALIQGHEELIAIIDKEAYEKYQATQDNAELSSFVALTRRSSSLQWDESDGATKGILKNKGKLIANRKAIEEDTMRQRQLTIAENSCLAENEALIASIQSEQKIVENLAGEIDGQSLELNDDVTDVIRKNSLKVVILNTAAILKNSDGTLNDPLLMKWLKLPNQPGSAVILFNGTECPEENLLQMREYFSTHHINVLDLLHFPSMTMLQLRDSVANLLENHQVPTIREERLFIDINRAADDAVGVFLSEQCMRHEVSIIDDKVDENLRSVLLHNLVASYNNLGPYSRFIQSIKEKSPQIIILNTEIVLKNRDGVLADPLLMEWLELPNKVGSFIVLLHETDSSEEELLQIRQAFSKKHLNVVGLLYVPSMTTTQLRDSIRELFDTHHTPTLPAERLCIDVNRIPGDELGIFLSEQCTRHEVNVIDTKVEENDRAALLHNLAYQYNYLAPYVPFFLGESISFPLASLFGSKTVGFQDTQLVKSVSIDNFSRNITSYYQKIYKGKYNLVHDASVMIPEGAAIIERDKILKNFRGYIGENHLPSFYESLRCLTTIHLNECMSLGTKQRNKVFEKIQELYLQENFHGNDQKRDVWVLEIFKNFLNIHRCESSNYESHIREKIDGAVVEAQMDFIKSAIKQHSVLIEKNPDIANDNISYLHDYFKVRFDFFENSIKRIDLSSEKNSSSGNNPLSTEEIEKLYVEINQVCALLQQYLDKFGNSDDNDEISAYYQQLAFYLQVLFSSKNEGRLSSISMVLKTLMRQENRPIDTIVLPNIKKKMIGWSEELVLNKLVKHSRDMSNRFLKEIKSGNERKEIFEQLIKASEVLNNLMKVYQGQMQVLSLKSFIDKTDNLLTLLHRIENKQEPRYQSLLSHFDEKGWGPEFKTEVANYIHNAIGEELEQVEAAILNTSMGSEVTGFSSKIESLQRSIQQFNAVLGVSFYEFRIEFLKGVISELSSQMNKGTLKISEVISEEKKEVITKHSLRNLPKATLSLQISPLFKAALETKDKTKLMTKALNTFKYHFLRLNYQRLTSCALRYFPLCKDAIENLKQKNSLEALVDLVLVGVRSQLQPDLHLRNCSNIAYLLSDLLALSQIEQATTGQPLPKTEQLEALYQLVSKHFLEQRHSFLSDPSTMEKLGFNWLSFWDSGKLQIDQQQSELTQFLADVEENKDYSAYRQKLLKGSASIVKALNNSGQELYGRIFDEVSIEDDKVKVDLKPIINV